MYGTHITEDTPTASVADRLPTLTEEQTAEAQGAEHVEWAQGTLEWYDSGDLHDMPELGVTLQVVSEDTVRCVSVHDHGYCFFMLSMLVCTFEHAGVTVQIDPYTIVRPYEASPDLEPNVAEGSDAGVPAEGATVAVDAALQADNFAMEVV